MQWPKKSMDEAGSTRFYTLRQGSIYLILTPPLGGGKKYDPQRHVGKKYEKGKGKKEKKNEKKKRKKEKKKKERKRKN
jgi:hypothetical protein